MNCEYCDRQLGLYDWCYMIIDDEEIVYAHLDCVAWEETMGRIETIDYLASVLTF